MRVLGIVMLAVFAVVSSACYVTQDASGQWWACETVQGVEGCTQIQAPF